MTVERNRRKTKVGVVVSDKMDKTVVVPTNASLSTVTPIFSPSSTDFARMFLPAE